MTALDSTDTPAAIAARALGVDIGKILYVERIKHGLTNDSFRITTAADAVVVRISNATEEVLRIDRRSEARVLAIVGEAQLGPKVLMCDPLRHILVTRDEGEVWSDADAHSSANIVSIAAVLRRLHALGVPADVRRVDLIETVQGYVRVLDERGISSTLVQPAVRNRAQGAALALRQHGFDCLCHNDIHHLNIVEKDGRLRLIDWEYSGVGEPLFDLASMCVYHGYDRVQREHLLDAYLPAREQTAASRLELACWLFEYVRDLWLEVRREV